MLHLSPFFTFAVTPSELEKAVVQTTTHEKAAVPKVQLDEYEPGGPLPNKTLQVLKASTADALVRLNALAQLTRKFTHRDEACALVEKAALLAKRFSEPSPSGRGPGERSPSEHSSTREDILALRRDMVALEKEIVQVRRERLKESVESCSHSVRARLFALSALQDILSGNFELMQARFGHPSPCDVQQPDAQILLRFDATLLKALSQADVCDVMTTSERRDLEERLSSERTVLENAKKDAVRAVFESWETRKHTRDYAEIGNLERREQAKISSLKHINAEIENIAAQESVMNRQIKVNDHYYGIKPKFKPALDRFTVLLDEASVAVASRGRMEKEILESLYREHMDLFSAFGVVQRLESWEFERLTRKGFIDPKDFTGVGGEKCRISNEGLNLLYSVETREAPYVVGTLDVAAELY